MVGLQRSDKGSLLFDRKFFMGIRIGLIFIFTLLLMACQSEAIVTFAPAAVTPATAYVPEYHFYDEEMGSNIYYSITIVNQSLLNGYMKVDDVESGEPGWLVIYAYDQRRTGAVVGYAPLIEGENDDFNIKINLDLSTPILFAVIHTDNGSRDLFEFPEFDPPVVFDGIKIGLPIQIESPEN